MQFQLHVTNFQSREVLAKIALVKCLKIKSKHYDTMLFRLNTGAPHSLSSCNPNTPHLKSHSTSLCYVASYTCSMWFALTLQSFEHLWDQYPNIPISQYPNIPVFYSTIKVAPDILEIRVTFTFVCSF